MENKSKLRILFICPGFGIMHRGVETFLQELINRIDLDEFDVTVLGRKESSRDGVSVVKIFTIDRSSFERAYCSKLLKMLRRFHLGSSVEFESLVFSVCSIPYLARSCFDIICPFGGFWSYLAAFALKKKAQILSIGHAGPVNMELRVSDAFIALTDYAFHEARNMLLHKPIFLIPNGVDMVRFHPAKESRSSRSTVLCVAAFTPDKAHRLLFDAMTLLDPSVRLLCVGPGIIPDALREHPACKSHTVEFRSATNSEMPELYRQSDVFTLPSPDEAFGIVFLEALATGLNVVAHGGPRQRFVLGSAGFYCDVYNKYDYASALKSALNSRQPFINMQRASGFDWNNIVLKYKTVFKELSVAREKNSI